MAKIDPNIFNTDPKFEGDRNDFDALVEGAAARIAAKKKAAEPPPEESGNIWDSLFGKKEEAK